MWLLLSLIALRSCHILKLMCRTIQTDTTNGCVRPCGRRHEKLLVTCCKHDIPCCNFAMLNRPQSYSGTSCDHHQHLISRSGKNCKPHVLFLLAGHLPSNEGTAVTKGTPSNRRCCATLLKQPGILYCSSSDTCISHKLDPSCMHAQNEHKLSVLAPPHVQPRHRTLHAQTNYLTGLLCSCTVCTYHSTAAHFHPPPSTPSATHVLTSKHTS